MGNGYVVIKNSDGTKSFDLDATNVEFSNETNQAVNSVVSEANQLTASDIRVRIRTYTIDFVIESAEAADYPNSSNYSDHNLGMAVELEKASSTWGITTAGLPTLEYDIRTLNGWMKTVTITESVETAEDVPRTYNGKIVWQNVDGTL